MGLLWVKKSVSSYPDLRVGLVSLAKLSSPGHACSARFSEVCHLNISAGRGLMTTIPVKDLVAVTVHWSLDTWRLGAALAPWLMPNTKVTESARTMCLCHVPPSWERVSCHFISESTYFSHGAYRKRKGRETRQRKVFAAMQIYN